MKAVGYIRMMNKRVVDLTAEELGKAAAAAWGRAAKEALAKGLAVTGSDDGRRFRHQPDGRVEDLGPVGAEPAKPTDGASHDFKRATSQENRPTVKPKTKPPF